MAVRELLLEFAGQALLDLVETGKEGDGDKDHDGALAVADFELEEIVLVLFSSRTYLPIHSGLHMRVPHEQRRTEAVSTEPSSQECWSRVHRGRLLCWFPARKDAASKGCCERSC